MDHIIINHNLALLREWQSGVRFKTNGDRLEIAKGFFDKLKSNQKEVQRVISLTVQQMDSSTDGLEELFFKTLKPMGEQVFNRAAINEQVINKLQGAAYTATKVEEVKFALKLGVDFQPINAGINGTYIGRDRLGKKILVFKPNGEDALAGSSPKLSSRLINLFIRVFPSINPFHNIDSQSSYKNEAIASIVNESLELDVVPKTTIESFESALFAGQVKLKQGSAQEFVLNAELAETKYHLPSFVPKIFQKWYLKHYIHRLPTVELKHFEQFALLDFIIGNQDRHLANFMIDAITGRMIAIDNGNSMPYKKPTHWLNTINQYTWAYLPQANQPFSEKMQNLVKSLNPEQFISQIETSVGEKLPQNVKKEMLDRINALKYIVEIQKPISALGHFLREKDFRDQFI